MQKARSHHVNMAPTACRHTVSGTISLPYSGYFSPFPHGTCALSVFQEYLALPDGSGGFRQDFTCPALLRVPLKINRTYVYRTITFYSCPFQNYSTSQIILYCGPTTPKLPKQLWFGLFPVRSPLLGESLIIFFSSGYLDVSVHQVGSPQAE